MGAKHQALLFCIGVAVSAAWQFISKSCKTSWRNHRYAVHHPAESLNGCRSDMGDAANGRDNIIRFDSASRRRFLIQFHCAAVSRFVLPLGAVAYETRETTTAKIVENVVREEQDLNDKLKKEERDEAKSIEDTKKLLSEIEDEIKDASSAGTKDEDAFIAGEKKIISDTEALIKQEEEIVGETQAMITEIETMESEVKKIDQDSAAAGSTKSEEFVNKLKQRVEEKEDLITKLKRESELYRDPESGKFRPMSQEEFRKRAASTDYDYVQILKDGLTNNEEFERDLEAFESLLERNFGSIMKELRKDESVAETEFERIKEGAGSVIKQIRKLF